MRMIDAVANSIERDPDILGAAVRLAIAVDDDFGDARIACQHPGIAAKADHRIGRAGPVFEDQARNEQVPAADVQVRPAGDQHLARSEEHTSELQSLMRISYAVFCLKKKILKTLHKHITKQNT